MIRALLRLEAAGLFTQRFAWVLLASLVGLQVARMLLGGMATPETSMDVVAAPGLWATGVGWSLRLLYFVLLILGAMGFSREFSLGTAKTILVMPLHRWQWYFAKLLFQALLAWGWLMLSALIGWLVAWLIAGEFSVVREGLTLATTMQVLAAQAAALALTGLMLLPLCALALLIGLFFHNSGAAVGAAVLCGLGLEAFTALWSGGKWLMVQYIFEPVRLVERMGRGIPYQWDNLLLWGLPLALGWLLLLGALGVARLERMDIGNG